MTPSTTYTLMFSVLERVLALSFRNTRVRAQKLQHTISPGSLSNWKFVKIKHIDAVAVLSTAAYSQLDNPAINRTAVSPAWSDLRLRDCHHMAVRNQL